MVYASTIEDAIEKYLFDQLEKIAPGRYTLSNILLRRDLFGGCSHLKGGPGKARSYRDNNLMMHTLPNNVTLIKCLNNCGLKFFSNTADKITWSQLKEAIQHGSSNSASASEIRRFFRGGVEIPLAPGPQRKYTDEERIRIKSANESINQGIRERALAGTLRPEDHFRIMEHPDPAIAKQSPPKSHAEIRAEAYGIVDAWKAKQKPVVQDSIPATKIKKARKSKHPISRKRKKD